MIDFLIAIIAIIFIVIAEKKIDKQFELMKQKIGPRLDMFEVFTEPKRKIMKLFTILVTCFAVAIIIVSNLLDKFLS